MEVMGLMLGQFVDEYTITCVDVFAMPQVTYSSCFLFVISFLFESKVNVFILFNLQHGTGVSVEAVDPVFQTNMLDMLKQTGRSEMVVGWYHSHPGFGCWLSGVDMNTQTSFEQLNARAVSSVYSCETHYLYSCPSNHCLNFVRVSYIITRLQSLLTLCRV